jgi:signal transduction histidine kinase
MREKTIVTTGKNFQGRIMKESVPVALVAVLLFSLSSLTGISRVLVERPDIFMRWKIGEIVIVLLFLFITTLLFCRRCYRELERTYKEIDSAEKIKDEFISNLRHELKTPLIPIKGYSELLQDENLGSINEKQRDALQKILGSCEKLMHRIDSLIFMSIANSGDIDYSFMLLRVEDILMNVLSELGPEAKKKEQLLENDIAKGLPFVYGDKTYLKEVFMQVLDNAIKFTPVEGNIRISVYEGHKSLHIKVTDNGIGIPEKSMEKVFDRFYQADGSKARKYNGNGLGLYVARSIITAHHGNIWIESIEGTGTTVHIILPEPDIYKQD